MLHLKRGPRVEDSCSKPNTHGSGVVGKKRTEPEIGRQNNKKRLMRRGELNTRITTTVRDNNEQMTTGDESVK